MNDNNLESQIKKRSSFYDVASANKDKLCSCSWSEAGKINLDICAHEPNCWIRRRLVTKRYTIDTSVTSKRTSLFTIALKRLCSNNKKI
jgi:hypothetical protein